MPDYKELYFKLFRASEQAISTLIETQRQCEELCISQREPDLKVFSASAENKKSVKE